MKQLAQDIYSAVANNQLHEPFSPAEAKTACPGWADRTFGVFLPKHRIGNPGWKGKPNTEWFEQTPSGNYKTIPLGWQEWSRITRRKIPTAVSQ
jgi:hypothetical protein